MLKHVPLGLGHPYRTEPFERTPHFPIAQEDITLRVCAERSQENLTANVRIAGSSHVFKMHYVGSAISEDVSEFGKTAKEIVSQSHLTDAAERSGEYSEWAQWEVQIPGTLITEEFTYFFTDNNEKTEDFVVALSSWLENSSLAITTTGPAVPFSGIEWLVDQKGVAHTVRFRVALSQSHHVVGLGERFHSVDQVGELVDAIVYEEYKGQGHRTYLPTPFLNIVGSNLGFHLNTSNPSRFSVGSRDRSWIEIEVDLCEYDRNLEVNFYAGTPAQVLKQYLLQVGMPAAPPDWIYSLWVSSNEWNTQERVQREIAECVNVGIKPGVVVIEAWSDESTFTVFRDAQYAVTDGQTGLKAHQITYPQEGAWPDPQQMITELHEQDLRLILWQIPIIKEIGESGSQAEINWNYAVKNNLVVKDSQGDPYRVRGFWFRDGLLPDLTDARVRQWWAEQRRYLVAELGVDGFKTDGGEHAWGQDLEYLDGSLGLEKNNLFPVHYAQTFHELLTDCGKDAVTFSRAGFTGSQKYPTFWAGDENSTWAAYRASINAGISASASGFFHWGWDIGGFSGELPSPELYLRGTAMATFCPIMQIHSEFNHHKTPSNDRTPWNLARIYNDPEILETFRKFSQLRNKLLPYLSREGNQALATGRPLMAGLFFDFYDDEEIWSATSEYMLGSSILVAPVTEPGLLTQKVYLPEGDWVSFWNDEEFTGKQWVEVPAPLNQIPAFILKDRAEEIKALLI